MIAGEEARAYLLNPLLRLLTSLGVDADAITLVAAAIGLAAAPLLLLDNQTAALVCLLVHVLMDGIDGPLARYQGVASPRGSFTDTFADQLVLTAVCVAWIIDAPNPANIAIGGCFIFSYAMVVFMAMVRNALDIPYSWLVRPRFFFYVALAVEFYTTWHVTTLLVALCDVLLVIKLGSGFFALRSKIPGATETSEP